MALTEREERLLRDIAYWLQYDDRVLAEKLRGPAPPDLATEWVIIAPVVLGLLVARVGDHLHIAVCVTLGVLIAAAAPLVVSIWLSHRR